VSAADRLSLTGEIEQAIETDVALSFQKLLTFAQDTYLPNASLGFGLSKLPRGKEMFAYAVRVQTTTDLTPDEIYELGMRELEKITRERKAILEQLGFKGTPVEFNQQAQSNKALRLYNADAVEKEISENLRYIEPRLSQLFANLPQFKYELKPVEPYRAANFPNGAVYTEDDSGKRIGVFVYNTYGAETEGIRKFLLPNLAFHEALPGHLLQANYAYANTDLPAFRRHADFNAFNEGWGTYAESLADEMGGYRDPYSRNFWLSASTFSYVSMVAQIGIESRGWTRDQTHAFIKKYLPMPEARFNDYLMRWSVMPGQGLGYAVGALRLFELRAKAERELGPKFEIRAFHDTVLSAGSMPLTVLDDVVSEWIAETKLKSNR
jgi:uncharacterized protein (DUF885 family)